MQPIRLTPALLALALGACSVDAAGPATAETKQAARDRMQSAAADSSSSPTSAGRTEPTRSAGGDVCLLQQWYDDGECDAWCPRGDTTDCAPSAGGVACAEFWSPADGYCNRNDPCGPVQDEDCQKGSGDEPCTPTPGPRPLPDDGKCDPRSYEELKADPDCAELVCPAIFSPADGKCDPKGPCDFLIDEDCGPQSGGGPDQPCADGREPAGCGGGSPGNPGVACDLILYETNGKCEAPVGCEGSDPEDCSGACIDIAYPTNGKCEAAPGCEASDPEDCAVACLAILYPTNGKCEAARGCEASDPVDCGGVICPAIAYAENGKCEAGPGCERSDPDC